MSTTVEEQARMNAEQFLTNFLGGDNFFQLAEVETGQGKLGRHRPWVERLRQKPPEPTVLPFWHKGDSPIRWYGLAFTEEQARRLAEELTAFVGPSWSTFRGQRAALDPQDPVDGDVQAFTDGHAFVFEAPTSYLPQLWDALELMRHAWEQRQERQPEIPRSTERVLREFGMALRAGNRTAAEADLAYLRTDYRLDALNLLFLRVRLLDELGYHNELLAMDDLQDLLAMRRPSLVTQALVRAVYQTELAAFEREDDATAAVAHFHEHVYPRYGALYTTRSGMRAPEVIRSFMLLAVGGPSPQAGLRDTLLGEAPEDPWLQSLASLLPASPVPVEVPSGQNVDAAMARGDFDTAFRLAVEAPPSPARVKWLLHCAYELQSLEAEYHALTAYEALSVTEKETLRAVRLNREVIDRLIGDEDVPAPRVTDAVPTSWTEWLAYLRAHPDWVRAVQIAEQGATEWSLDTLLEHPEQVEGLVELLQSTLDQAAEHKLQQALPHLLRFFQQDAGWPRRAFQPLYSAMIDVLVVGTQGIDADLEVFNELMHALLTLGLDGAAYEDLLEYVGDLWDRFGAISKLNWALEMLDLLIVHPCPSEGARLQLLFAVAEEMRRFNRRLEPEQRLAFALLVEDLGQSEALADLLASKDADVEENVFAGLNGQSVLLYSLSEAAASRARQVLLAACPSVTVHLSHDHGGTDRLKQLSRTADYVVMAWACATHAATNFIRDHRPADKPILFPRGKGFSSMIEALKDQLAAG